MDVGPTIFFEEVGCLEREKEWRSASFLLSLPFKQLSWKLQLLSKSIRKLHRMQIES